MVREGERGRTHLRFPRSDRNSFWRRSHVHDEDDDDAQDRKIGAADGAVAVEDGARPLCERAKIHRNRMEEHHLAKKCLVSEQPKPAVQLEADHHVSSGHI